MKQTCNEWKWTTTIDVYPKCRVGKNGNWVNRYDVTIRLNGGFVVDYRNLSRDTARKVVRDFKNTGILPTTF